MTPWGDMGHGHHQHRPYLQQDHEPRQGPSQQLIPEITTAQVASQVNLISKAPIAACPRTPTGSQVADHIPGIFTVLGGNIGHEHQHRPWLH